jgi:type III pantothenate kinase
MEPNDLLLALCVGNTRTRAGLFHNEDLVSVSAFSSAEADAGRESLVELLARSGGRPAVAVASVNDPAAKRLLAAAGEMVDPDRVGWIGREIPIPMRHDLDDASTVGQDRWLTAYAAYSRAKQACVVVDAGTAVTVDFVDGQGVFRGGVIAPGLTMMLDSLHRGTAALPLLPFAMPDAQRGPLGRDTAHAMRLGVLAMVRGLVRVQLEACAEMYGAYPQVIATGGDMAVLEADGMVEHFVPDLQLLGLRACVSSMEAGMEDA